MAGSRCISTPSSPSSQGTHLAIEDFPFLALFPLTFSFSSLLLPSLFSFLLRLHARCRPRTATETHTPFFGQRNRVAFFTSLLFSSLEVPGGLLHTFGRLVTIRLSTSNTDFCSPPWPSLPLCDVHIKHFTPRFLDHFS